MKFLDIDVADVHWSRRSYSDVLQELRGYGPSGAVTVVGIDGRSGS